MLISCKEMISSPNEDLTCKVECIECRFLNNGEIIKGTIVLPRVYQRQENLLELLPVKENSEIFTLYISK